MRVLRLLLMLAVFIAAPLAVSGLWSAHALDDSEGFAEQMRTAWTENGLQTEFGETVRTAAVEEVYAYFGVAGADESLLADAAANYAVATIDRQLSSGAFVKAWTDWHEQLHRDLAASAKNEEGSNLTVDGSIITVDASALVDALLSGPIGALAVGALGDDAFVQQIDAGYDVEGDLASLGTLWANRWWFVLAAAAAMGGLLAVWRPRRVASAAGLLAAAAGCAAVGIWRSVADPYPPDVEPSVHGEAIAEAFAGDWTTWLFVVAAVTATAGVGALASRRRQRPAEVPTPALGESR